MRNNILNASFFYVDAEEDFCFLDWKKKRQKYFKKCILYGLFRKLLDFTVFFGKFETVLFW